MNRELPNDWGAMKRQGVQTKQPTEIGKRKEHE